MISIINFEKSLTIPKEEAEKLGLKYKIAARVGIQNNEIKTLGSYDLFKEDCIFFENKYYKSQKHLDKNESVSSYYLFTKYVGAIKYVSVETDNHLVDLIPFAQKCKHKFYIKESIISEEPTVNNIHTILQTIEDKTTTMNNLVDKIKDNTFNSKTNVHVGGGLIATYNDLLLKEDVCTDDLQQELNNGWRIIAVCVQPDQRRPDYILGRYNPNLNVENKKDADR